MSLGEILLVDDEPANLRVLDDLLTDSGYDVRAVTSGDAALRAVELQCPDLVLLDILMPGMDGYQTCLNMRENESMASVPILFISALSEAEDIARAFDIGGRDYIVKPIRAKEVLARVKTHLEHYRMTTRLEEEVEKRTQELIHQSKYVALGEMIGMIAHQLKQPLQTVSMSVHVIKKAIARRRSEKEDLPDYAQIILQQVDHMAMTIDQFQEFLRPSAEETHFKPSEMALQASKLIDARLNSLDASVKVVKPNCLDVYGRSGEFKQAVLNIYNNACDAFEDLPGKNSRERTVAVSIERQGGRGVLRIRDNAGGIPEGLLPTKLFQSYVSTKGEKGTGLGLQISKMIIEGRFGGKLTAANVDGGAEFTINLPLNSPHH